MKWHPSEPVQWLEASYDDHAWGVADDNEDFPSARDPSTGWAVTRTVIGGTVVHRPYSAPMFWFRECDDASGPAVDVDMTDGEDDMYCGYCREGLPHRCVGCMQDQDHMTGALCPACWSRTYSDDQLPALIASSGTVAMAQYAALPGVLRLADVVAEIAATTNTPDAWVLLDDQDIPIPE